MKSNCLRVATVKMVLSLVSGRKVDFNFIGIEQLTMWLNIRSLHSKYMNSKDKI
jgi:hypothetical protein